MTRGPMTRDKGSVVLITGAAGGIGSAIARRYAADGARLVLTDVDEARLGALAEDLAAGGTEVAHAVCDVTKEVACRAAVSLATETFGGIDVLVNNAGRTHLSLVEETDASVFREVMELNFYGAVHMTQAALPSLVERKGAVAVLSSVAGFAPLVSRSGYAASKHALHGFFGSLRGEMKARGVSVTLVCPSFVRTDIGSGALGAHGGKPSRARTETGRLLDPADVATALVRGVERRRSLVLVGRTSRLAYLVSRVAPDLYERLMLRRLQEP